MPRIFDNIALDLLPSLREIGIEGSPATPNFDIMTRAARHEPDLFFTNKYMALIEKELFG